jgi:DNA (cytosine-5)-methyltransferase 1
LEENCAYGHFNYNLTNGELIVEKVTGKPDEKFTLTPAVQKYVLAGGTSNYRTSTETDLPIARTLMKMMTQHHRAGVDNYVTVTKKPLVLRQLSDREALRLMGFPDDFKIAVSSMQTLRQAGNSIVVDVLMAIVKRIIETGVYNYERA